MKHPKYVYVESTPGYMPDSEPSDFEDFGSANAHLREEVERYEEEIRETGGTPTTKWSHLSPGASWDATVTRDDTVGPDLGRRFEIEDHPF